MQALHATAARRASLNPPVFLAQEQASGSSWPLRLAIAFLFLYYIRPQDWIPGLGGFNIIQPLILAWTAAIVVYRDRGTQKILRSPHDWVILAYFAYVVYTSPDGSGAFKGFLPSVFFYFLTVLSLDSVDKIFTYLKWWCWLIVAVAGIGVASLYGFDLTGARALTAMQNGRLAIGTWIHNNPNALGHSVIVALPMAYCLYFWKGNARGRTILFPLTILIVGHCVYSTQSKGAFLVGAGLIVFLFVIGRPIKMKVFALAFAMTLGVGALKFLPRMQNIDNIRKEPGVSGRLMVWDIARGTFLAKPTGEGWKQFEAYIRWEGETLRKATHSSYVKIGADLGKYGLAIFVAGLWCAAHSLIRGASFGRDDEIFERCRRAAFFILLAYALTSWMVNKEYHPEYFLLIAVAASLHRVTLNQSKKQDTKQAEEESEGDETTSEDTPIMSWKRFGLLDLSATILFTWLVFRYWSHQIENL